MRRLLLLLAAALVAAPAAAAKPSVQHGEELFGANCVTCHGPNGRGGTGRGPSLHGVGALAADFYLRTGYMPLQNPHAQPRRSRVLFSKGELASLVAYVASRGHGPPIPKPHPGRGTLAEGQEQFLEHCAGCHQIDAEGGYVTNAVAPPLEQARPVEIAEAVRIGPYLMPRFSQKQISDAKLDSIIRYIQYAKHPDDRGGWSLGHVGPVPEGLVAWFIGLGLMIATCLVIGKRLQS